MLISKKFKDKLKKDGRSLKWFYDNHIKGSNVDLTYSGFTSQLNDYAPVSEEVEIKLSQYLKKEV